MQTYTNHTGIPLSIALWLATDDYDHNPDPNTISVTSLLKPLKQTILAKRVTGAAAVPDVAAQLSNRIGSAVHSAVERSWLYNSKPGLLSLGYPQKIVDRVRCNPTAEELLADPNIIPIYLEQRANKVVDGMTISGKFDLVVDGYLEDIKMTGTFTYKHKTNDEKWRIQGSCYRWLNPDIVTKDTLKIQYIFKDFMQSMAKTPDYPPSATHEYKIKLMSVQEADSYIRQRVADYKRLLNADEADMPPCSDEDLWRKEPVFKYYKNPNSTARSTKNFNTFMEAHARLAEDGFVGNIVEVKGEVVACKYCDAFSECKQKDAYVADGSLKL